ncbi:Aquaporin-like protein [Coniochaeta hoffmannii]|uniref:Aquaporin-like protein n=1 Tax=Coniochaeta hoffmannii TaxID=91930 RepID=A0AA38VIE4_9PEZI|nr:Aquaporin-like protein [Coniochaeta hoffmannii]
MTSNGGNNKTTQASAEKPFKIGPPRGRRQPFNPFATHLIAALAEFVGTFMFLFMSYAGQLMALSQAGSFAGQSRTNSSETVLIIALAYGISLLVSVWAFYRISGGLFNPVVTLAFALCGKIHGHRALILFPTQLLASMVAGGLASALFPPPITWANTTLAPGVSVVRGLFIEMFLTSAFVFAILMLAGEKSKDTFIAPIGIGLALFAAEIAGVYYTGGSLNPARSLGPAVAGRSFPGYHWIYWLGPLLGALLASAFYYLVKFLRYEDVNPGQDSSRESSEV